MLCGLWLRTEPGAARAGWRGRGRRPSSNRDHAPKCCWTDCAAAIPSSPT